MSKGRTPSNGATQSNQDAAPRVDVVFRNSVPEIPKTTYGTFSIYKYPAKFIPQVIAYTLKKYARPESVVFDPFAGYGTVGVVSRVYGHDYELWDLNPIMNLIHDTAVMNAPRINVKELVTRVRDSNHEFCPDWSNLTYWFPEEFLPTISKAWGLVHATKGEMKKMLSIPLLKATRYFSYSDEKVHKLYKSKHSKKKVDRLLGTDWETAFYRLLEKQIEKLLNKMKEYSNLNPQPVRYKLRSGIDSLNTKLDRDVDILITSPPYLQAQEYISEEYVRSLSKKELPYNSVEEIHIHSEKYQAYRKEIVEDHLIQLYDRYFHGTINAFATLGERVKDYMCIFVGPAKIRTRSIPIDEILVEHLTEMGWKHLVTYVDPIVSRSMFKSEVNPASGYADSRMATEHLVILKRV
jgi:hypothetical protein